MVFNQLALLQKQSSSWAFSIHNVFHMKILIVSNQVCNPKIVGNPILYRMKESLARDERVETVDFERFRNRKPLKSLLAIARAARCHDIVHVHFGGIYSLLVRLFLTGSKSRKLITFHGTDIHAKALKTTNNRWKRLKIRVNRRASFVCISRFDAVGFVSNEMKKYVPQRLLKRQSWRMFTQPLGVDYRLFTPLAKEEARAQLNISNGIQILFSDVHNSSVKRRDIAEQIVENLGKEYHLLVMCGISPNEVPLWLNACDLVLLTSDEEGSPNIIREGLSLNKRIFSVDVGDARRQLEGLVNSTIISRNPSEAARQILRFMAYEYTDNTRDTRRDNIDFDRINKSVVDLYERLLAK